MTNKKGGKITKKLTKTQSTFKKGGKKIGQGANGSVFTVDSVDDVKELYETWNNSENSIIESVEFAIHYANALNQQPTFVPFKNGALKQLAFKMHSSKEEHEREINVIKTLTEFLITAGRNLYDTHQDRFVKHHTIIGIFNNKPVTHVTFRINQQHTISVVAMKRCDGDLTGGVQLNKNDIYKLLTRIVEFLYLIQGNNMYHWDIKPENILYTSNGDKKTFYLADFGGIQTQYSAKYATSDYTSPFFLEETCKKNSNSQTPLCEINLKGLLNTLSMSASNDDIYESILNMSKKANKICDSYCNTKINSVNRSVNKNEKNCLYALGITLIELHSSNKVSEDINCTNKFLELAEKMMICDETGINNYKSMKAHLRQIKQKLSIKSNTNQNVQNSFIDTTPNVPRKYNVNVKLTAKRNTLKDIMGIYNIKRTPQGDIEAYRVPNSTTGGKAKKHKNLQSRPSKKN